jgi:hypothetical protein
VTIDPEALAQAIQELHQWAQEHAPRAESPLQATLSEHLGGDPRAMPIVHESLGSYERPNLQVALDAWLDQPGRDAETVGVGGMPRWRPSLSEIVGTGPWNVIQPGPVEYVTVEVGARQIRCLRSALLLLTDGDERLVACVSVDEQGMGESLRLELMAPETATAEAALTDLRALMLEHNVYRGHVLEVQSGEEGLSVAVRSLPPVPRERIMLPAGVLERVERHTLGVARHAERLRAAGRHLKRGLLLHGPPGTGKTLTAMHLSSRMPDRTVLLLTGAALYSLALACGMARTLAPAMVVLEDVDLVAEDRDLYEGGSQPVLFQLLNEMDGLAEDADVVFVLTTNRLEALEPALAARPGRIDEAVELPLPDPEGRRRLLALFSEGLDLRAGDMAHVVDRTEGLSPAFIRELVRRAALLAAEEDDAALVVDERHLDQALDELQDSRERVTRVLLGTDEAEM